MNELSQDDLVLYSNKDGKLFSGGFNINSIIFNKDLSPIFNINTNNPQYGGNVSDLFNNLAIPRGLLYFNNITEGGRNTNDEHDENDVINDDLYNKLLNLVEFNKNKHSKTKDNKNKNKNKKTKKHKY